MWVDLQSAPQLLTFVVRSGFAMALAYLPDIAAQEAITNVAILREIIAVNYEGMRAKDKDATDNVIKAIRAMEAITGASAAVMPRR